VYVLHYGRVGGKARRNQATQDFFNIVKSTLKGKEFNLPCHDVEFENLMISQVSSKVIHSPGLKVSHCNQYRPGHFIENGVPRGPAHDIFTLSSILKAPNPSGFFTNP
jgi:hypothetical protein